MTLFLSIVQREMTILKKRPLSVIVPWAFFLLVGLLFPFALSTNPQLLQSIGAGIIWVAILLAQLLSASLLFQQDYEAGVLDQWLINQFAFTQIIAAKIFSQWLWVVLPMIALSALLSVLYNLPLVVLKIELLSLLLGTPILTIQSAIVSALGVSIRAEGLLLAIIVLPLYIPTLIFGASIVTAAEQGLPVFVGLELLGALLIASLTLGPSVAAFALKISMRYG